MRDSENKYLGINEYVEDLMPMIKWYLAKTGQKLVDDPDAVTGASVKGADASTGASSADEQTVAPAAAPTTPETDASTGASEDEEETTSVASAEPTSASTETAADSEPDDVTGASEDE